MWREEYLGYKDLESIPWFKISMNLVWVSYVENYGVMCVCVSVCVELEFENVCYGESYLRILITRFYFHI